MKIDYCLILSAGLGTRMGNIGKVLPKPIWPIFEKSMLELQYLWAKKMGCDKVFINTHHLHLKIETFLKQKGFVDLETIHEETLLNTGGALYNLKKKMNLKKGIILIIAGDQFYFFENSIWRRAIEIVKREPGVLFGLTVEGSKDFYNELCLKNDLLVKIEKYSQQIHGNRTYTTYSGLSLINLEMLENEGGPVSFFDSVANFNEKDISVLIPKHQEYWDLGTNERYYRSIRNLFECLLLKKDTDFLKFCLNNKVFDLSKVSEEIGSYGDYEKANFLNFGKVAKYDFFALMKGSSENSFVNVNNLGIYYRDIFDHITDRL
jgi:mannose-1-phosphate guanylyltransferase